MGWTKEQLINRAFSEIGLNPKVFNVDPDKLQEALDSLDSMMATWSGKGIRLGYALPSSPDESSLAQASGLPDIANEAVFLNLALRIAPGVGKQVSPDTRASAGSAYAGLVSRAAFPPEQQLPNNLPRGAGNKPWRGCSPFTPTPTDPLLAAEGGDQLTFE